MIFVPRSSWNQSSVSCIPLTDKRLRTGLPCSVLGLTAFSCPVLSQSWVRKLWETASCPSDMRGVFFYPRTTLRCPGSSLQMIGCNLNLSFLARGQIWMCPFLSKFNVEMSLLVLADDRLWAECVLFYPRTKLRCPGSSSQMIGFSWLQDTSCHLIPEYQTESVYSLLSCKFTPPCQG